MSNSAAKSRRSSRVRSSFGVSVGGDGNFTWATSGKERRADAAASSGVGCVTFASSLTECVSST
jgi:hypothetical protein